ncbi:MAG: hypothetical protein PVS2B2_26700 [Candidatus Acidiferrum sp.]
MPTLNQLAEWVRVELGKGKGDLHTNHVVIIEDEAKKKIENKPDAEGKQKTKIAWETKDPETFGLLHAERERYFHLVGGNPVLGTTLMIMALKIQRDEDIKRFIEGINAVKENAA